MEAVATADTIPLLGTRKESKRKKESRHAKIDKFFDGLSIRTEAKMFANERQAYHQALRDHGVNSTEFKSARATYSKAVRAHSNELLRTKGPDAAKTFERQEHDRAAHTHVVKYMAGAAATIVGAPLAWAYGKLVTVGGGARAVAGIGVGYVASRIYKDGIHFNGRTIWKGIGTVNKDIEAEYQVKAKEAAERGLTYAEFAKENPKLASQRINSKRLRLAGRIATGFLVAGGTAHELGITPQQAGGKAAEWFVHLFKHFGLSEHAADMISNGDGSYLQFMHKIAEAARSSIGAAWNVFNELFIGLHASHAQTFGNSGGSFNNPNTQNGGMGSGGQGGHNFGNGGGNYYNPNTQNGQFRPGPQTPWPQNNGGYNGGYHGNGGGYGSYGGGYGGHGGGYNNGGNFWGNFATGFGYGLEQSLSHQHYGGYNGYNYAPQMNGDGYWGYDQYGQRVWMQHTGHFESYHHEEHYHEDQSQQHQAEQATCPPERVKSTPEEFHLSQVDHYLARLGSNPAFHSRAEALSPEGINATLKKLLAGGMPPQFENDFRDMLQKAAQMNEADIKLVPVSHEQYLEMTSGSGVADKNVELNTALKAVSGTHHGELFYHAERMTETVTGADGNKYLLTFDRLDECNNGAIKIQLIHETHTGGCAPGTNGTEGVHSTHVDGQVPQAVIDAEQNIGGKYVAEQVLHDYGNPTTHDLLSKAYADAGHLANMPQDEIEKLHALQRAINANETSFVDEQEYYNTPASDML